jgi:hypothetical protein
VGVPFYLLGPSGKAAYEALQARRQPIGRDPAPSPRTEREEILHRLWLIRVTVAGAELESTEYLRDLLQKYEETQAKEAERMQAEAAERVRRSLHLPSRAKISEALRDVDSFRKAKRDGRRRLYQGSGVEAL